MGSDNLASSERQVNQNEERQKERSLNPTAGAGHSGDPQSHFFSVIEQPRTLVWFSAGATSAVATGLALKAAKAGKIPGWIEVLYCETGGHHEDNLRFIADCEKWLGCTIKILRNPKYTDLDHVIEKERYLNGPEGAKCTQQLKIAVRKSHQRPESDIQVFGFHAGEVDRAAEYRVHHPEVQLRCLLIEAGLYHDDCLALLRAAGIELPMLYRMGYRNNNCLGCVKGGMGYWNKVRVDFPEVFARRAKQERAADHSCIKGVFLDELEPGRGNYPAEPDIACEGVCVQAKRELENCDT